MLGSGNKPERPLPLVLGRLAAGSSDDAEANPSFPLLGFGKSRTNFLGPEAALFAFVFGGGSLKPFEATSVLVSLCCDEGGRFASLVDGIIAVSLPEFAEEGRAVVEAFGGGRLRGIVRVVGNRKPGSRFGTASTGWPTNLQHDARQNSDTIKPHAICLRQSDSAQIWLPASYFSCRCDRTQHHSACCPDVLFCRRYSSCNARNCSLRRKCS